MPNDDYNDMAGRVMAHAFNDELEKIAKMPRAVREGGGGAVGAKLREKAGWGRLAAKSFRGRTGETPPATWMQGGRRAKKELNVMTGRPAEDYGERIQQGMKVEGDKRYSSAELKRLYAKKHPRFASKLKGQKKYDTREWYYDRVYPERLVGAEPKPRKGGRVDWRRMVKKET
jgi:hypothetical protein